MEEIEYLEEYEDFILPNGTNCTQRLSDERKSIDSLEGLYKDLIGDSSCGLPEKNNVPQYSTKASPDKAPFLNTVGVGLFAKPLQIPKCNANSGSTTCINKTSTSDIQNQLYKCETSNISFTSRASNKSFSVLQKSDKLKSVATVKPTLQRINNPAKQCLPNSSPPLKCTTVDKSIDSFLLISSSEPKNTFGTKVVANVSKRNVQKKNSIKTSKQYPGSGVDPLSLDDQDAFLDFDVDKNGSGDDFDFESDLDNSITAGISDMDSDSVDLSDEYSDGNFELESDLSSETSDVKRGLLFKRKKLQEANIEGNAEKFKNKLGAFSNKPQNKIDQTSLSKNKQSQNLKANRDQQYIAQRRIIDSEKWANRPAFGERKMPPAVRKPQLVDKKESLTRSLTSNSKERSFNEKLSNLSKQLLNNPNGSQDKTSNVFANSKKTAVIPNCKKISVVKEDELAKNPTLKTSSVVTNPEKLCSEKRDTNKTFPTAEVIKNRNESLNPKSIEPFSDETTKKISSEPKMLQPLSLTENGEHSNHKNAVTPEKNVPIKFGSLYLRSIKPPICKRLMVKQISPKSKITSEQQQAEQNEQAVTLQSSKKHIENQEILDKNISQKILSEKEVSILSEDNKIIVNDSKSDSSNLLKKEFSRRKSPVMHEDNKSSHKSREINESNVSNEKSRTESLKLHMDCANSSENDCSIEKCSTSNQNDVNEQIGHSINCSAKKSLESITNENNSLKESAVKLKEHMVDSAKISTLLCKFSPRSFEIRLNKNTVARFLRDRIKPKEITVLKDLKRASGITLKRKMHDSSANGSESDQDKIKKPQKDLSEEEILKKSRMTSDALPAISDKPTEIQAKDAENSNKETCPTSRKRKKRKIKSNVPPKLLRSSLKSVPHIPNFTSHDKSNKERGSIQKPPRSLTNVASPNGFSTASNLNSTENEVVRKRAGRQISKKNQRKASLNKIGEISQSNDASGMSALPHLEENICSGEKEHTSMQTAAALIDGCIFSDNTVSENNLNMNSETEVIQPKQEIIGDSVIMQYQQELTNRNTLAESINSYGKKDKFEGSNTTHLLQGPNEGSRRSNQLLLDSRTNIVKSFNSTQNSDSRNDTEFTVFELPSYIVMKTKIITRKDLHSNKALIPPIVKEKIDKLAEERQAIPIVKTERPDFKDVCLEINALLGQNANYLKFASGSERQTRMNQVLSDSSLSVDDAQCALKFLQSYLSLRAKDVTVRSKGQQFIPIYDSQKKIIGYRKRTTRSKKPLQSNDFITSGIFEKTSNLNASAASSVEIITHPDAFNVRTVPGISPIEKTVEFSTKKEPQPMDAGDEEIIVPDVAPATETCIKNETENMNEVT